MRSGRVIRFAIVGVVNTGTYYVLYLALSRALPYLAAHAVAFALSMLGSYLLNCYFTFRVRPTWRRFALFPLSNLTNFVVTSAGLYLLVSRWGMDAMFAPLLAAAGAIPVTYVVSSLVLTGRDDDTGFERSPRQQPAGVQETGA